jgi:hypothetical protein
MKKIFLIMAATVLFLSACSEAISVPVMTATSAETSTPESTSTPEQTPTPAASPTPDYTKPYAVSSPDGAEFFFPLPEQEWEWFLAYCGGCFPSGVGPSERTWRVFLDVDEIYELTIECNSDDSKLPQKGSASEMLAECQASIWHETDFQSDGTYRIEPTDYSQLTFSYINDGLTIELTESTLTQALYEIKPESLLFHSYLVSDNSNLEDRDYDSNLFDVVVTYE